MITPSYIIMSLKNMKLIKLILNFLSLPDFNIERLPSIERLEKVSKESGIPIEQLMSEAVRDKKKEYKEAKEFWIYRLDS